MKELFKFAGKNLEIKVDEECLYVSFKEKEINLQISLELIKKSCKGVMKLVMDNNKTV